MTPLSRPWRLTSIHTPLSICVNISFNNDVCSKQVWASLWQHVGAEAVGASTELLVLFNVGLPVHYFSQLSLYVCRAIIIRNNEIIPMSTEFTPESERQRLQFLVRKLCTTSLVRSVIWILTNKVSHTKPRQPTWNDTLCGHSPQTPGGRTQLIMFIKPQFLTVCSHDKQHNQQGISSASISYRAVQQLNQLVSWE